MKLSILIPGGFSFMRLQERLRYYADQFGDGDGSRRLSDTLREAADELDLTESMAMNASSPAS